MNHYDGGKQAEQMQIKTQITFKRSLFHFLNTPEHFSIAI